MDDIRTETSSGVKSHLLIAGTGRAGTSFLVTYLTELGLDTHLSRHPEAELDEFANAGLEDIPVAGDISGMPYVIKTPWLYEFIDQVLADKNFHIDAVIIPIRDLMDAAASRTIVELQLIHRSIPWMKSLDRPWKTWGTTPGGQIYSLDPADQARLLAVGFHYLIERLTSADVPIVLLSFPRMVEDPYYLFSKLQPHLPGQITAEEGLRAFKKSANPDKVAVHIESRETMAPQDVNHTALKREFDRTQKENDRLKKELEKASAKTVELTTQTDALQYAVERLTSDITTLLSTKSWKLTRFLRQSKAGFEAFIKNR